MKKAIVLSSGGLDSTTCLSMAIRQCTKENVVTVSVQYGQKHDKELQCAQAVADFYGVKHYTIDISNLMQYSNCALLKTSTEEIEHKSYDEQITKAKNGMVSTYVPFRNGLMLSAVATLAMSLFPEDSVDIYIGAHADDAAGNAYADCSPEFIGAIHQAIRIGTYNKVGIVAPFAGLTKADVVATGLRLGTPYELTWSCYEGGDKPCGTCGTCIDRAKAFELNNAVDPALES